MHGDFFNVGDFVAVAGTPALGTVVEVNTTFSAPFRVRYDSAGRTQLDWLPADLLTARARPAQLVYTGAVSAFAGRPCRELCRDAFHVVVVFDVDGAQPSGPQTLTLEVVRVA